MESGIIAQLEKQRLSVAQRKQARSVKCHAWHDDPRVQDLLNCCIYSLNPAERTLSWNVRLFVSVPDWSEREKKKEAAIFANTKICETWKQQRTMTSWVTTPSKFNDFKISSSLLIDRLQRRFGSSVTETITGQFAAWSLWVGTTTHCWIKSSPGPCVLLMVLHSGWNNQDCHSR